MVPSRVAGDLDVAFGLARMVHRHQVLAAVLGPFHRPADMAGGERDEEILRIELAARAEAAADVVLHHVDRALRASPICLARMRRLKNGTLAAPETREPRRRAASHSASKPARLHGQRRVALHAEALAPHVRRVAERRRGVAAHGAERDRQVGALRPRTAALGLAPTRARSATAGSGSMSTSISLERVLGDARRCRPAPRRSARRRSAPCRRAITGCANGSNRGSGCSRMGTRGTGRPMSLAVITACTPGIAQRRATRRSSGCGRGRPSCAGSPACSMPVAREIVDILRRARAGSADPRARSIGLPMRS